MSETSYYKTRNKKNAIMIVIEVLNWTLKWTVVDTSRNLKKSLFA